MSQRQIRTRPPAADQPRVSFEIREVMAVLTALERRAPREETRNVH